MNVRLVRIALLIQAFLFALSCSNRNDSTAMVSTEGKWPCFNGCSIILSEGKYGLMNDGGDVILPCNYDSIEFLDNDVALLLKGELGSLCNRKGRIIINSESPDSLRINYAAIVEEVKENDYQEWDEVISCYSKLCDACKKNQGHRLNRSQYRVLKELFDELKNRLNEADGQPTPSQKARLKALSDDYRRAF